MNVAKIRYSLNISGRIFNRMVLKEYQKKRCNTTIRTLMFGKTTRLHNRLILNTLQQPYFCVAKTHFLSSKNPLFALQKGGF